MLFSSKIGKAVWGSIGLAAEKFYYFSNLLTAEKLNLSVDS